MQQMLSAQHTAPRKFSQALQYRIPFTTAHAIGVGLAYPQGIEHGGDARRGNLGVVRQQGRRVVPAHFRARHQVAFKIVGMYLDHTW